MASALGVARALARVDRAEARSTGDSTNRNG